MCEQYVARSALPFRLESLWDMTERLERFGVAGFGWGIAWLQADGKLRTYRDIRAFRDDPGREVIGGLETTAALVHLRRPTKLSTVGLADTQPFGDPADRYCFSHNGDFLNHAAFRARFRDAGRLHGMADSEIAARWLEDAWRADLPAAQVLRAMHDAFGGLANLAVLTADGGAHHYAGNRDNPVFSFRLGAVGFASTGLYSIDRSLFRHVAIGATDRHLVRLGAMVSLDMNGMPQLAQPGQAGPERDQAEPARPAQAAPSGPTGAQSVSTIRPVDEADPAFAS